MTSQTDSSSRRLVPRWRYIPRIIHTAEYASDPLGRPAFVLSPYVLNQAVQDWHKDRTIATAADVVATAVAFGKIEAARDAAEFLIGHESRVAKDVIALAKWILRNDAVLEGGAIVTPANIISSEVEAKSLIHLNRRRLTNSPRNIGCRLDLSLGYAVLGLGKKAWTVMNTALALAPNNRAVLRTAVRLLVHLGRVDEAYILIRRHPRTLTDPWLMSLELTLSTILGQSSHLAIRARRLIDDYVHEPSFIAELACAGGMLEWLGGYHKRGRRLLQLSLNNPTDNVIAQAQWAKQLDHSISVPPTVLSQPGTMEANYWHAMGKEKWTDALEHASAWHLDEPFSSRPAVAGSFLAIAIVRDLERALRFAEVGLRADGNDQLLRNNYVVALARADRTDKARSEFQKIREPLQATYPKYAYLATKGLLAFVDGNPDQGRNLYLEAVELATGANRQRVLISWIETESRYSPAMADYMITEFGAILRNNRDPMISAMTSAIIKDHKDHRPQKSSSQSKLALPPQLAEILQDQNLRIK